MERGRAAAVAGMLVEDRGAARRHGDRARPAAPELRVLQVGDVVVERLARSAQVAVTKQGDALCARVRRGETRDGDGRRGETPEHFVRMSSPGVPTLQPVRGSGRRPEPEPSAAAIALRTKASACSTASGRVSPRARNAVIAAERASPAPGTAPSPMRRDAKARQVLPSSRPSTSTSPSACPPLMRTARGPWAWIARAALLASASPRIGKPARSDASGRFGVTRAAAGRRSLRNADQEGAGKQARTRSARRGRGRPPPEPPAGRGRPRRAEPRAFSTRIRPSRRPGPALPRRPEAAPGRPRRGARGGGRPRGPRGRRPP